MLTREWVWLVVGVISLGGAVYLCAMDRLSGEVLATLFGVVVKGLVDALGGRHVGT